MTPEGTMPVDVAAPFGAPPPAAYGLRPLSLGEILDRTFAVYRSRFFLFAGLAAVYSAVALVLMLLNLYMKHLMIPRLGFRFATTAAMVGTYLISLLLMVPAAVTQAATVFAVSEVYLGKGMTAIGAFKATIGRWYRYLGIALWLAWCLLWVPLICWIPGFTLVFLPAARGFAWLGGLLLFLGLCALPYGYWSLLRNSLAVQAAVIEGLKVRDAMRRSKVLTVGGKGRIFVVSLIAGVLMMTVGAIQTPLVLMIMRAPLEEHFVAQSISLLINFAARTLVTPVGLIGLSLIYFDQRVRQEALDLLMMLGPEPVTVAAPVQYAEVSLDPADPMGDDARL